MNWVGQVIHAYGLTETSPFILSASRRASSPNRRRMQRAAQKARQGVELVTSGELRVVDAQDRDVPQTGTPRRDRRSRQRHHEGLFNDPRGNGGGAAGRLDSLPATRP